VRPCGMLVFCFEVAHAAEEGGRLEAERPQG
jgi:hypothetical protein